MKRIVLFLSAAAMMMAQRKPFNVVEATIPEMKAALEQKQVTSRELVTEYLVRIATYEHILHAAVTINPNALKDADQLDRERASRENSRPAARHPHRAQRQYPYHRHAHHRRSARFRRFCSAL